MQFDIYTFRPIKYLDTDILNLFIPVRNYFLTDYDRKDSLGYLIELIRESDLFYKVYKENKFLGCIYINNLNIHSCEFNAFAVRKCGADSYKAGAKLVKYLFSEYNIKKIKAIIDKNNKPARFSLIKAGFKYEYTMKKETIRDGKLIDRDVYTIFKGD